MMDGSLDWIACFTSSVLAVANERDQAADGGKQERDRGRFGDGRQQKRVDIVPLVAVRPPHQDIVGIIDGHYAHGCVAGREHCR